MPVFSSPISKPSKTEPAHSFATLGLLLLVSLLSLYLFTFNNDFPLGFHPDEVKKVRFVLNEKKPDFHHPILIIQTAKIVNHFVGYSDPQKVAEIGRTTTAFYGVLLIISSFLIIFFLTNQLWVSTLGATLLAANPVIISHTHYLKEDIALTATTLFSMYWLLRFLNSKSTFHCLVLGFSIGLMASSHYKSILFLLPIGIGLFYLLRSGWEPNLTRKILLSGLLALSIFILINNPLLFDFLTFLKGGWHEFKHSAKGHTLYIPFHISPFFHLRKSLFEYTSLMWLYIPFLAVAIAAILKKGNVYLIILIATLLVNYFVIELSPLKTSPGFVRYAIPIIPFLVIISMVLFNKMTVYPKIVVLAFFILIGLVDFTYGYSVIDNLEHDIRMRTSELGLPDQKTIYEAYSLGNFKNSPGRWVEHVAAKLSVELLESKNIHYLVISSFEYQRYLDGANLPAQKESTYRIADQYSNLLNNHSYVKMYPVVKPIGFFHPEIIIVKLSYEI